MSDSVPIGWSATNLGELCTFGGGSAFKEAYQGTTHGKYPFIKVSDMNSHGNEKFIINAANWIDESIKIEAKIRTFPPSSIVFAKVGAALLLNRRRILTRETAIDNNMMAAIPNSNSSGFLYYLLQDVDLSEIVQSGAVPSVNQAQMEDIPVLAPPLPEQQKIATILSSVDDVIEKTRAQIDKLKDLKTGMMQELLTQGIGHTEFKDSPVGRIPQSWKVKPIGSLFFVQLGKMLNKAAKQGNAAYPYLGNKNVQWGKVDISELETMDFSSAEREKFSLIYGDLLICEGGDVGRAAIWRNELKNCYFQKAIHRLRPKDGAYKSSLLMEYLAFAKKTGRLMDYISQTSIAHLTKEKLESVPVPVPDQEEQRLICQASEGIDKNISKVMQRLDALLAIKKALMQDLLTGKVRVKPDSPEVAAA